MSAVDNKLVSTKEVDYLDEDKPIRGQNFVLLSFISPEDVIVNKEAYIFNKFIHKFSDDMKKLLDGIKEKNPEQKDMINTIVENHSYIFEPKEMNEQYAFYKSVNNDELESNESSDVEEEVKGTQEGRGRRIRYPLLQVMIILIRKIN